MAAEKSASWQKRSRGVHWLAAEMEEFRTGCRIEIAVEMGLAT